MSLWLKKSTATTIIIGPFVDSIDAVTPETALDIVQADQLVWKNGGALGAKNDPGSAVHRALGHYETALSAVDTNTLGRLRFAVYKTEALPLWADFMVIPAQVYDSLVGGTDQLDVSLLSADQLSLIDAGLNRAMGSVSDTNPRSPLNALRKLMNKWSITGSTLTVFEEDDTTTAFTQAIGVTPGADPVTSLDTA
jgi:hypothetical protein